MTRTRKFTDRVILGADIGGSSIKAALAGVRTGKLTSDITVRTPSLPITPRDAVETLASIIRELPWRGPFGIGYPGVVQNGVCLSAANVSSEWLGRDALRMFSDITSQKVAVINDADAAGLAELRFGAGKPEAHARGGTVLVLTLGTGIGSALFHRGHLFPNTEFGHIELKGDDAEKFAAASVRTAQNLDWEDWAERLNTYLAEMEKLVSPDLIVLGGGITENYDRFGSFLKTRARLECAALGNSAGILGAALAVDQLHPAL
jgi:polyphosphate glucokinase